jgi:uncharacterized lipoprotein YmbA
MTLRRFFIPVSLCSSLALFVLAGCNVIPPVQPDTTRYYVLTGPALDAVPAPAAAGNLMLGLRPVEIAPYLRKGSMVVRTGENEIAFANDARWAEPLEQEIAAALRHRLRAAPTVARVFVPPFPIEPTRDFDISVQVLRCEGVHERGGHAVARFAAIIEISSAGDKPELLVRKTFVAPEAAWDGKDFGHLAALLSDDAAALAQDVVTSLPEKK